jgi:hypothetical protein
MIFVFGSNLAGIHGAGAARDAEQHHGAVRGIGEGRMGNSYALPTKDEHIRTMALERISRYHVPNFLAYARAHPELQFQVTRIGCGLAGFKDWEIAPMFETAPANCLFDTAWRSLLGGSRTYWGTF